MYTEEQFEQLEQEERTVTDEQIAIMLSLLNALGEDLEKELRSFYQKYGKDGVVTWQEARKWVSEKDHSRRLTALMLAVGERFSSLLDDLEPEFETIMREVIGKESSFFNIDVDAEKLIFFVWGADQINWLVRLQDHVNLWEFRIVSDLKQALLQRKNINLLLSDLAGRVDSMKQIIERLGLTESTAIGSATRKEIFKTLGISQYRFYTKYDERTCETCGGMHDHTFPISAYEVGVTASPLHPRCRCWEVPITE